MKRWAVIVLVAVSWASCPTGALAKVKAGDWVSTARGPVFVEFSALGNGRASLGTLRLRLASESKSEVLPLRDPQMILALLADKRMQFLWQPLTDWAGPGLESIRDSTLAHLRGAWARGAPALPPLSDTESQLGLRVRALLQLTNYLMVVGQHSEAEQLLRDNLSKMAPRTDLSTRALEWQMVAFGIARSRLAQGDSQGAVSTYALVEATLGDSPYAVNATVNRAAVLVESGEYSAALTALDSATAKLRVVSAAKSKAAINPGSDLQFAWIRACAFERLGRTSEAREALHPLLSSSDQSFQAKARVCMGDVAALKRLIAQSLSTEFILSDSLLFQPGFVPTKNRAIWDAVRADPELQALANQRMRVLPPELTAALNGWTHSPVNRTD